MSAGTYILVLLVTSIHGQQVPERDPGEVGSRDVHERQAAERRQALVGVMRHIAGLWVSRHKAAPVTPTPDGEFRTTVDILLTLAFVLDLDDVDQVLTTSLSMDVHWTDAALAWNASDHGGVEAVELPVGYVWIPDIYLVNSRDNVNFMRYPQKIRVTSNGSVTAVACASVMSNCLLDHSRFPYDTQTCSLFVFAYSDFVYINLSAQTLSDSVLQIFPHKTEWDLLNITSKHRSLNLDADSFHFPEVQLVLKRKTLFYNVCLVLPLVLTSYMNTLVFLTPLQSGEKVSYLVSIFVSTSVFISFFTSTMPRGLDSVPATMKLMIGIIVESFLVLLCTLAVLTRHHRPHTPPPGHTRETPFPTLCWTTPSMTTTKDAGAAKDKESVPGRNNKARPKITKVTPVTELEEGVDAPQPQRERSGGAGDQDSKTARLDRIFFVVTFVANSVFLYVLWLHG